MSTAFWCVDGPLDGQIIDAEGRLSFYVTRAPTSQLSTSVRKQPPQVKPDFKQMSGRYELRRNPATNDRAYCWLGWDDER